MVLRSTPTESMPTAASYRRYAPKRKAYTAKRNARAKKPYAKRSRSTAVANTVKRVLASQEETKWTTTAIAGSGQLLINRFWQCNSVNTVAPGSLYNQRIGEYISPKSLNIRLTLTQGLPASTSLRIIVFKTKLRTYRPTSDTLLGWGSGPSNQFQVQDPATNPLNQWFNADPSAYDAFDLDNSGKGMLLKVKDMTLTQGGAAAGSAKNINMFVKLASTKLHYTPGDTLPDSGYYVAWQWFNNRVVKGGTINTNGDQIISAAVPSTTPPSTLPSITMNAMFKYTDA